MPGADATRGQRRAPRRALRGLARSVEWLIIGAGYAVLPVWPLVAALIARDAAYLRRYLATLVRVTRHLNGTLKGRSVSRFVLQKLAPQPVSAAVIRGSCSHCGNCCLYRGCVFLDYDAGGRSRCRIYGGRVWKLLACGDYPATGPEIELYTCPSFVADAVPARPLRVIPIATAGFPALAPARSPATCTVRADGE